MEGQDLHLDSNAGFPNINVPFRGLLAYGYTRSRDTSLVDAHPAGVLLDILTSPVHGAGVPASALGDWTSGPNGWFQYCAAYEILLSPIYDSQQTAVAILEELAAITNTAIVFSEGVLKMRPYGDEATTSARLGVTYDP